jgi:hypothetical protein
MTLCSGLCGRNLRTQVLPSRRSRAGGLCRSLTTNPGTTIGEEKDFLAFVAKIYLFIYFITIIIYLSIHPSIYTLHRTPWTFHTEANSVLLFPPFFSPFSLKPHRGLIAADADPDEADGCYRPPWRLSTPGRKHVSQEFSPIFPIFHLFQPASSDPRQKGLFVKEEIFRPFPLPYTFPTSWRDQGNNSSTGLTAVVRHYTTRHLRHAGILGRLSLAFGGGRETKGRVAFFMPCCCCCCWLEPLSRTHRARIGPWEERRGREGSRSPGLSLVASDTCLVLVRFVSFLSF